MKNGFEHWHQPTETNGAHGRSFSIGFAIHIKVVQIALKSQPALMTLRGRNDCNFLSSPRPCIWGQFTVGSGHYSSVSGLIIQVLGIQGYAEGTVWSCLRSLAPAASPQSSSLYILGALCYELGETSPTQDSPPWQAEKRRRATVLSSRWANPLLATWSAIHLNNSFLHKLFQCEKEEMIFFSMVTQHSFICHRAIFWRLPVPWQGNKHY